MSPKPVDEIPTDASGPKARSRKRVLADGRQQLLVYLSPAFIKRLKLEAVERDLSVSSLVGEAVALWLKKTGGTK